MTGLQDGREERVCVLVNYRGGKLGQETDRGEEMALMRKNGYVEGMRRKKPVSEAATSCLPSLERYSSDLQEQEREGAICECS